MVKDASSTVCQSPEEARAGWWQERRPEASNHPEGVTPNPTHAAPGGRALKQEDVGPGVRSSGDPTCSASSETSTARAFSSVPSQPRSPGNRWGGGTFHPNFPEDLPTKPHLRLGSCLARSAAWRYLYIARPGSQRLLRKTHLVSPGIECWDVSPPPLLIGQPSPRSLACGLGGWV